MDRAGAGGDLNGVVTLWASEAVRAERSVNGLYVTLYPADDPCMSVVIRSDMVGAMIRALQNPQVEPPDRPQLSIVPKEGA